MINEYEPEPEQENLPKVSWGQIVSDILAIALVAGAIICMIGYAASSR